jgi:hypothetical protein
MPFRQLIERGFKRGKVQLGHRMLLERRSGGPATGPPRPVQ